MSVVSRGTLGFLLFFVSSLFNAPPHSDTASHSQPALVIANADYRVRLEMLCYRLYSLSLSLSLSGICIYFSRRVTSKSDANGPLLLHLAFTLCRAFARSNVIRCQFTFLVHNCITQHFTFRKQELLSDWNLTWHMVDRSRVNSCLHLH